MSRQTAFITTTDIELAASYMEQTGRTPAVFREPGNALVSIEMVNDQITQQVMMSFAIGDLMVNARRFSACRAYLYRTIKAVK